MTQPMPRTGVQNVTPFARRDFDKRLTEREKLGLETYDTPLQTFNGRDAVQDAQDEAIDLYQYLEQAKMERAVRKAVLKELLDAGDAIHRELCDHFSGHATDSMNWLSARVAALKVLNDG